MTDNATPKKRTYSRPKKYPAAISIMTTTAQRAAVDEIVDADEPGIAEVVRGLIDDGLMCRELDALDRAEIDRLAALDGVSRATVLAELMRYGIRKIDRVRRGIDRPEEITLDVP